MSQVRKRDTARHLYLIALGSNASSCWGTSLETVETALDEVQKQTGGEVVASAFFNTPAFPAGAGPDYVNAAARITAALAPHEMLNLLHGIEAAAYRTRTKRWEQRTLDLDLIAADALVLPDQATFEWWRDLTLDQQMQEAPEQMILPHPRMHERAFVLVPLAQVAADWQHPVLQQTVAQMRDACAAADLAAVTPL